MEEEQKQETQQGDKKRKAKDKNQRRVLSLNCAGFIGHSSMSERVVTPTLASA